MYLQIRKINNFQGDLIDISDIKQALLTGGGRTCITVSRSAQRKTVLIALATGSARVCMRILRSPEVVEYRRAAWR